MKTKKPYLAANIRAGVKIEQAREWAKDKPAPFKVIVTSHSHGRDVCGNGTAHYLCELVSAEGHTLAIVESGKRREQVGYSGMNEAALYALGKLGYELDTSKHSSYDYQGAAVYPLINFATATLRCGSTGRLQRETRLYECISSARFILDTTP